MAAQGKYTVLEPLGSGGMGRVFKGVLVGRSGFERPIVIKQVHDDGDAAHLRLFVEEARRYARLDHENIGRIFDFEEVDGRPCMIMEYIDGWTLTRYQDRHCELGLRPGVEMSVFIVSRVCRALQYVFEQARIVHRDVSPTNVMTTREGTVKLIDFGIATQSGARDSTLTGKPAYMAPERVLERPADNRSDLFSLGVVLWELLAAERLFSGDSTAEVLGRVLSAPIPSPRERNPEVPEALLPIVFRALERDPAERFPSAAAMGAACEHFLYDKGYGPTNLTLKHYLRGLFLDAFEPPAGEGDEASFPVLDAELVPIDDGLPAAHGAVEGPRGGSSTRTRPPGAPLTDPGRPRGPA